MPNCAYLYVERHSDLNNDAGASTVYTMCAQLSHQQTKHFGHFLERHSTVNLGYFQVKSLCTLIHCCESVAGWVTSTAHGFSVEDTITDDSYFNISEIKPINHIAVFSPNNATLRGI